MSNIMAALGNEQLKRFNKISNRRKNLATHYDKLLKGIKNIDFIKHDYKKVVPHIYVIRIKKFKKRDELIQYMKNKGVEIGFHYMPNHFFKYFNPRSIRLKNTEEIFPELLSLPLHLDLTFKQQILIIKNLINYLNK